MDRCVPMIGGSWDGNYAFPPDSPDRLMDLPGYEQWRDIYAYDEDLQQWNFICQETKLPNGGIWRIYGSTPVPMPKPKTSLLSKLLPWRKK